jgi:hypothetical protein
MRLIEKDRESHKPKNLAIIGLISVAALAGGIGLPLALAAPATQSVVVTNTTSNPVPVTGTVAVGSLPAVTGSVSVNNLPAVQQVGGTVGISGTPNVVAVEPEPFQAHVELTEAENFSTTVAIPSGKRLIVQTISAFGATFEDQIYRRLEFTTPGPVFLLNVLFERVPRSDTWVDWSALASGNGLFRTSSSFQVSLGGSNVGGNQIPITVTISGYLVPA